MVSYATRLPTDDDMSVPNEIHMSTPAMRAAGVHMAKYCEPHCKEFMLCRKEEEDPRKCLKEGKQVTACGIQFLQQVKKMCLDEFNVYAHCIDHTDEQVKVGPCKAKGKIFAQCVWDKMGIETPQLGYFMTPMSHTTSRPKPPSVWDRDYKKEAEKLQRMDVPPGGDVEDYPRFSQRGTALHEAMDGN